MAKLLKHPILNPNGDYDEFNFNDYNLNKPEEQKKLKKLRNTITSKEFIDLISGKYGHTPYDIDSIKSSLGDLPIANNPNITDIAINKLASVEGKDRLDGQIREILNNFQATPKMLEKVIEVPEDYGMLEKNYHNKTNTRNKMLESLQHQKALTPELIDKIVQRNDHYPFTVPEKFIDHPSINASHINSLIDNDKAKIDSNAIKKIISKHQQEGILGERADDKLGNMIKNSKAGLHPHEIDDILEGMTPDGRRSFIDKHIGLTGGEFNDEDLIGDSESNYDNWNHGPEYNSNLTEKLASSKHLNDYQADHIMRHHDDMDTKWNLFHNDKINNKHADKMYEKWLDDDHNHGYDLDDFKEKIKEENEINYDDWYDDARNAVEEDYPISQYIRDNISDEDLMGEDQESWIKSKLQSDYDWTHKLEGDEYLKHIKSNDNRNSDWVKLHDLAFGNGLMSKDEYTHQDLVDAGIDPSVLYNAPDEDDPKSTISKQDLADEVTSNHDPEINYEREDMMEEHPEYQDRYNDAEADWEKELEKLKTSDIPDHVYDGYSDYNSESESEKARELYDEHMENAHENEEFLPSHLTSIQEIKRKKALDAQEKARIEAEEKEKAIQPKLNQYIPNRPKDHLYAEGQHHIEMAKDYADANNGSIDLGHLNKMHPNMVEKWKKIFNGKGKLSSQELQQKIDELPKSKYSLSYGHWNPHSMQNLNHQDEMVIRLDHSPESLDAMKQDPEAFDVFNKINDASQRSGHPTNHNTIGWARVDFSNPKHPMVDELQSDFGSAARDYLKEHGGEAGAEKAKHLDKVIAINKNWRETLLNAVAKIAKNNGAEQLSTHSPESKAAHTGAGKVHSVYKDSYEKIPRQLGFKPSSMDSLPLTEEGKKAFTTGKSGQDANELIEQHLNGLTIHGFSANAHREQAQIRDNPLKDIHNEMADKHQDMFKQHLERIKQLDPTHDVAKFRTFNDYSKYHMKGLEGGTEEAEIYQMHTNDAQSDAQKHADGNLVGIPVYGFDSALKQQPAVDTAHNGHTLQLNPAAFKKHIIGADFLMKSQSKSEKMAIAQALMNIQSKKEEIEQLKEANPDAYNSIAELTQVLVDLFKEINEEPIEAVMHEAQVNQEIEQTQQDPNQQAPQQETGARPPRHADPLTHGKKEFPVGAQREYDPKTARQKTPEGKWISTSGGTKKEDFQ